MVKKGMRVIGADAVFSMNATSTIDDRNEIKITLSDTKQPSMTADERGATTDDGKHRRRETVFWKIQFHHNNIVFFLVPLLLMILKETSALPPIIKIGEWPIFAISFQASCEFCHICNESIIHICFVQTPHVYTMPPAYTASILTQLGVQEYALALGTESELIIPLRRYYEVERRRRPLATNKYSHVLMFVIPI